MKPNTTIIAAVAVLLAGVGAFAFLRSDDESPEKASTTAESARSKSAEGSSSQTGDLKPTREVVRKPKDDGTAALIERYGASRTNLSRQVVNNVTSMLDDVLEMGDLMTSGQGGQFGNRGDWVLRGVLRGTEIELDEDQKKAAADLYTEFQIRELEKTRAAVDGLKEDPSSLMAFMLASDARSRDEIGEEEYQALQQATAKEMEGILNPLDRNNFRGGRPLDDPEFRSGFESLLDDEQRTSFETTRSEREASGQDERRLTNITEMPVMDLESLDQSISSAKQMASGFKNIMQGMGNLRELEQQRSETSGE